MIRTGGAHQGEHKGREPLGILIGEGRDRGTGEENRGNRGWERRGNGGQGGNKEKTKLKMVARKTRSNKNALQMEAQICIRRAQDVQGNATLMMMMMKMKMMMVVLLLLVVVVLRCGW